MHHFNLKLTPKQKELIKRTVIYIIMILSVIVIVTLIFFFVIGFRLDTSDGRLAQYALLQFDSKPSGATVTIDGKAMSSKTANSSSVPAGEHKITMSRDGYATWSKTINAESGVLEWLKYAILVPKDLTVKSVAKYNALYSTLASTGGHYMLVEENSSLPTFNLVDLSSDTIKTTKLTIPASVYSEAATPDIAHTFQIKKWDDGGRYVLIKHLYGDKDEWLVLDTKNTDATKNITTLFDFAISDIKFSGTSGNLFYALGANNVRKLDLSAGTMSRALINNVTSFDVYNSNIVTYAGYDVMPGGKQIVGVYRDGDNRSYILRTKIKDDGKNLNIATVHYFNDDYVAISDGQKVDVLKGTYPNSENGDVTSLAITHSYTLNKDIDKIAFSPTGEYVFAKSGSYYASYDLEYKRLFSTTIEGSGDTLSLDWLDSNYLWSDRDGKLTIREFDGANVHIINSVVAGQDVVMTSNGRYLYSIGKSGTGYQLQRVRMILP